MHNANPELVQRLDQATPNQIRQMAERHREHTEATLPDRVIRTVQELRGTSFGHAVDFYEHSLQTATRAYRDNARVDLVVAALLHDIGDVLAPANHAEMAASVIRPFVDDETAWVVQHHDVFQGYHFWHKLGRDRNARDVFVGHRSFDATARFCADWDLPAFEAGYDTLPLNFFEPALREVFARPPKRRELTPPRVRDT